MKNQMTNQLWRFVGKIALSYMALNVFIISEVLAQDDIVNQSKEYRRTAKDIFREFLEWMDMFAVMGILVVAYVGFKKSQKTDDEGGNQFNGRDYAIKAGGGAVIYFIVSAGIQNYLSR